MKKFEDRDDGSMYISENEAQIYLDPYEVYNLWQWMSARKDTFQPGISAKQLKMHPYQGTVSYPDELKAALPDQHEPIAMAFDPGWDPVHSRALQLHKDFQAQYSVHPLLEDDSTYAQG